MKLRRARVLVVGGANSAGPLPDLTRFLSEDRVHEVTFIGHPFAEDAVRQSRFLHQCGGRRSERTVSRESSFGVLSYLWDLALTVFFLLKLWRRHDLYVSGSPHFGLLGLLLKRLGVVARTVFWTHDYHPKRFNNPLLNGLYLRLDRLLAERSEWAWDVVPTISEHRLSRGVRLRRERVLVVGDPLDEREMAGLPQEEPPKGSILFSGLVKDGYGFDLLLEAMPDVLMREPQARVAVTTYQPFPERLRRSIRERGLEDRFDLLGFIPDEDDYTRVMQQRRVGLALYEPRIGTHKRYSDSRVKPHLGRGLPVVMTGVSPIAAEVERAGAGIVIDYDVRQLTEAVVKLLSDDEFYRRCQANALALAEEYSAERVFGAAFRAMEIEL